MLLNEIFDDLVAHAINLFYEGHGFDSRQFGLIKLDYLVNGDI